jgi:hypothetical protein
LAHGAGPIRLRELRRCGRAREAPSGNREKTKADESLAQLGDMGSGRGETVVALFDWSQQIADLWCGTNNALRREILDSVCLNCTLGDVSLVTTKRKPFDVFAERLDLENSRGDRI